MGGKAASITFRITQEERDALQAFIARQPSTLSLSEAIRCLIHAGLKVAQPRPLTDLRAVLKEMDPSWTGRKPRLGAPIKVHGDGLGEVLDEERAR